MRQPAHDGTSITKRPPGMKLYRRPAICRGRVRIPAEWVIGGVNIG
jgi:hypothetical protein